MSKVKKKYVLSNFEKVELVPLEERDKWEFDTCFELLLRLIGQLLGFQCEQSFPSLRLLDSGNAVGAMNSPRL